MAICDLCHQETANRKRNDRGELLCGSCRIADDYYSNLTPEQRHQEDLAMARYAGWL